MEISICQRSIALLEAEIELVEGHFVRLSIGLLYVGINVTAARPVWASALLLPAQL